MKKWRNTNKNTNTHKITTANWEGALNRRLVKRGREATNKTVSTKVGF